MTHPEFLSQPAPFDTPDFDTLLADLSRHAAQVDQNATWPEWQFSRLADEGVLGWVIPNEYGGSEIDSEMLIFGYERLATACLTTTFILTQRNGACQRIAGCGNVELKAELLPNLCTGRLFATVGVSHLTTSRQHLTQPAVQVEMADDMFVLNGQIPWVTGAKPADYVVTGGTCEDGRQVLIALPTDLDGVSMEEPSSLLALDGSLTGSIGLDNVTVDQHYLLAGPVEGVMSHGQGGGTGSVATSSLAVGLAGRSIALLMHESDGRPDLRDIVEPFAAEWSNLRFNLYSAARGEATPDTPHLTSESIRQRANSLALRSTQALLAATKGAGFVSGHPAERGIREAMFFLVWSCPQPIVTAALREFACLVD
ncbi:MAG: acyl-CoA/acyl-ACP dehydrogenase [Planctomycetaceae bacterium]|nr:acyl-CoA/acyl-ACP dehydrogenase [Planctomycetaceae bacterium]